MPPANPGVAGSKPATAVLAMPLANPEVAGSKPATAARYGPSRAAYGPSITAVPGADESSVRLLVFGGVTAGGYRGATGALHTVELLAASGSASGSESTGEPPAAIHRISARWTNELSLDGLPRAYHSATLLPSGGEAHTSNQHKLWVFGGSNDEAPRGWCAGGSSYYGPLTDHLLLTTCYLPLTTDHLLTTYY